MDKNCGKYPLPTSHKLHDDEQNVTKRWEVRLVDPPLFVIFAICLGHRYWSTRRTDLTCPSENKTALCWQGFWILFLFSQQLGVSLCKHNKRNIKVVEDVLVLHPYSGTDVDLQSTWSHRTKIYSDLLVFVWPTVVLATAFVQGEIRSFPLCWYKAWSSPRPISTETFGDNNTQIKKATMLRAIGVSSPWKSRP